MTTADLAQAGGQLTLLISQIAPASGSSAGSSGHISLGTYLLQLVNAHGQRITLALHAPVTLAWHYGPNSGPDLANTIVTLNTPLPHGVHLAPAAGSTVPGLGTPATKPVTVDGAHQRLSVQAPLGPGPLTLSWNTNSPVATFGTPDPFNVGLSAGSLSASYPLALPSGPGGLTPPLTLAYSSESVSEQHSPQGATGWVGEGWSLSPGSISWDEHDVTNGCSPGCGGANWENSWQLSDPYGTSTELIPPHITTSIYYDDSGNTIATGSVTWQTASESYAKVISFVSNNTIAGMSKHPPCWRVFLTNGLMEEFGCTPDSIQYYFQLSGGNAGKAYVSSWFLDLITDREGNQIHFTYQADTETDSGGHSYPRDVVLASVQWDSPTCSGSNAVQYACTSGGTPPNQWQPMLQVSFQASHSITRSTGNPNGKQCNGGTNLRCDDPKDLSGSGGMKAPQVESTFVLNDILVQVNDSGTWQTLKDYQLSFAAGGPHSITDPGTGQQESVAGVLELTQMQEFGDDLTTSMPIEKFGYSPVTEYYEDDAFFAVAGACGPTWNSACLLWSQSYDGNSYYLTSVSNGMGLEQTFSWANARNNTHSNNVSNFTDPLYCNSQSHQSGYPCDQADDQSWSHVVLTQETDQVLQLANTPVTTTTNYSYKLATFTANACSDCDEGMYWGNQNDADYQDYYNGKFEGFAQATVTHWDHSKDVHQYYVSEGWGLYDTSQVTCYETNPCHRDQWWTASNALHGREKQADYYDIDGTTHLKEVKTAYSLTCPPNGVSGSGSTSYGNFNGNLVSELDDGNPVAVCEIETSQVDTYTYDGSTASGVPHQTTNYTYDSSGASVGYGRLTQQTVTTNDGGATGSPTTLVYVTSYVWNDAITTTSTGATGTYLIDFPAWQGVEDTSGALYRCQGIRYDGHVWESGAQSTFTGAGKVTLQEGFANCAAQTGWVGTGSTYDQWGNPVTTTDADAEAGNSSHTGCTVGGTAYTTCMAYDPTFEALTVSTSNALNQTSSRGFGGLGDATGGYGLWPTSATDPNGQTTTYTYDALGRMTSITQPGETGGLTTTSRTYTDFCDPNGGAQTPCIEVDLIQRVNSTTTITMRDFYDGEGHLAETRTPGSNGQDIVQFYFYDPSGRQVFASNPYYVTAYTGGPGAAAYSIPDTNQVGTTTTYTNLRTTSVTDPLSHVTTTTTSVVCSPGGVSDTACYVQVLTTDANAHQQASLTDALGRQTYVQSYTGNSSSTYALYATVQYTYDAANELLQLLQPDGTHATTYTYDTLGRKTGMTDPDRGTESYGYDPNGNVTQTTDARGSTVYAGYDGLNRPLWRNTTNSPSGAYVTYTYDGTVPNGFTCGGIATGSNAIGQVTTEKALSGPGNSFSYTACSAYDGRGQLTASYNTINTNAVTGQTSFSYDDAGTLTQVTYPNGDQEQYTYSAQEQLTAITGYNSTTQQSQLLVSGITYNGTAGPAGEPDSYTLGGTNSACAAANSSIACVTLYYDADLRLTSASYSHPTTSTPITYYNLNLNYDAVGNVIKANAALPAVGGQNGGNDNQAFCYDELNRLTYAVSSGTFGGAACIHESGTDSTLQAAEYTATYQYDTSNRLTQSTLTGALSSTPQGSYTYDSSHLHAVDAIGNSGYEAQYDASGNMTCRTVTGTQVCTNGNQTGAKLTYDVEGRLIEWDSADGTTKVTFGYTGEGARFIQQVVTRGQTTSTTSYLANEEIVAVPGQQAVVTAYFTYAGKPVAEDQGGHWYYLLTDGLGSVDVVVDATGVIAAALFGPYGQERWAGGTMPTSYAFTGQRADSSTGLDYYGARYYDPAAGIFTSADTVGGFNRYAYVADNPETLTDPTGHRYTCSLDPSDPCNKKSGSGSNGGGNGDSPTPCGSKTSYGQPTCSSNASACKGKKYCFIFIDGGIPGDGKNGFKYDMKAWRKWIDALFEKYGGEVGFILLETDGSDAQNGADEIHQTLQALKSSGYSGTTSIIAASAGASALFVYLNRLDSGQYAGSDAQISAFIAIDAPTKMDDPYASSDCESNVITEEGCSEEARAAAENPFNTGESIFSGWNGATGGAADYVRKHHISGVYVWATNDPLSSKVSGGGAWDTFSMSAPGSSPHQYIEGSPYSMPGVCLLCYLPNPTDAANGADYP